MTEAPAFLPAVTLQAQLRGLATLGIDMQRMYSVVGPVPEAPEALIPVKMYVDMWSEAHAQYGMPGLPTALAMAIPFGAFGALDYLAGSANTLAGYCESAALHFAMVASDTRFVRETLKDGSHLIQVRGAPSLPAYAQEFTIASLVSRLRYISDGRFRPLHIGLPTPKPEADPVRERLLGTVLVYDLPNAEIAIDADTWKSETSTADPFLHATLTRMAEQLQLTRPGDSDLERALRVRLRGALAQGNADPARMATLLGVSERTLQRRLAEADRSFTAIVEDFRREESARLLSDARVHLVEIASRLGYAEQTSFTRAFRRWTGTTPSAWRANRVLTKL